MIRAFRLTDAAQSHRILVDAVLTGAASRSTDVKRHAWVPDPTMPAMPADRGASLAKPTTLVAGTTANLHGSTMIGASGYLTIAFVAPAFMGKGIADQLDATLRPIARKTRLTTRASRFAQSFVLRHGWHHAPAITDIAGMDPNQSAANPMNRPMALPR